MDSWDQAFAESDGWDSSAITNKTLESALKVRNGVAEFEQDGVVCEKIRYSATVIAFLILAISRQSGHLNILEFGGGLATGYFQNRKILRNLPAARILWNIVERPNLAKLGAAYFAKSDLRFFHSLDQAAAELKTIPDAFLFSGSLHCVARPLTLLDHAIGLGAKILAFDRLLVSAEGEHAIYVQRPDPGIYYAATYPVWCFSKELFVKDLTSRGFTLIENFASNQAANFDHCGMIFAR
jgi:putative methyltransferase (TIGR04325 family)